MKRLTILIFSFFFCQIIFCQSLSAKLDSLFKTIYKESEPGAIVAIRYHDEIIFKKGYGLANIDKKTRIESFTNFNIGSLTKQFTAYSILKLADEGKLSLDDKLIKYFPAFNPDIGNKIMIRQLLTHSSGIIDHYGFTNTNIVKHATDKDVLEAIIHVDSTYFVPGEHYRYSNTAYCLLALIIEKLSRMSYHDFIQKNIFEPLGMNHSALLKIGSPIYNAALGYHVDQEKKKIETLDLDQSIFFSTEGDGGIYTSMDDYLKWSDAWQNGNKLKNQILQNARSAHFPVDSVNKLSYGYGWFISEKNKEKIVYHTGSNGGFRAISFFIPSYKYQLVIFSNRDDIDLEELAQKVNDLLHISNKSFTKVEKLVSLIFFKGGGFEVQGMAGC
ncbi:MAG: beta-lactamase family protein [Bacteroidetes bacterium]|nr:beta-lactamase family protein [Bacteroidota bacterium]